MESPGTVDTAVVHRLPATHDGNAAQVANAMVATWYEIDVALSPIIGSKAVVALYKRIRCGWVEAMNFVQPDDLVDR